MQSTGGTNVALKESPSDPEFPHAAQSAAPTAPLAASHTSLSPNLLCPPPPINPDRLVEQHSSAKQTLFYRQIAWPSSRESSPSWPSQCFTLPRERPPRRPRPSFPSPARTQCLHTMALVLCANQSDTRSLRCTSPCLRKTRSWRLKMIWQEV